MDSFDLPVLGRMKVVHVLDYFDEPILFICCSDTKQLYLAIYMDDTDTDSIWHYAPISVGRLRQLYSGDVDLHDAFAHTEKGIVWEVWRPNSDSRLPRVVSMSCRSISDSDLPLHGVKLFDGNKSAGMKKAEAIIAAVRDDGKVGAR